MICVDRRRLIKLSRRCFAEIFEEMTYMYTKFFDLQRFAIYGTEGNDNLVNNADY